MNHLKAVNRKAARVEQATEPDVVALQRTGLPLLPHFPIGCSWSSRGLGGGPHRRTADCANRSSAICSTATSAATGRPGADQLNHAPDWTSKCAAAQKDWRKNRSDFSVGVTMRTLLRVFVASCQL